MIIGDLELSKEIIAVALTRPEGRPNHFRTFLVFTQTGVDRTNPQEVRLLVVRDNEVHHVSKEIASFEGKKTTPIPMGALLKGSEDWVVILIWGDKLQETHTFNQGSLDFVQELKNTVLGLALAIL